MKRFPVCDNTGENITRDVDAVTAYDQNACSIGQANKFVVQGEQHYWVHVAIDRFTNQVIDKQIEVVNE